MHFSLPSLAAFERTPHVVVEADAGAGAGAEEVGEGRGSDSSIVSDLSGETLLKAAAAETPCMYVCMYAFAITYLCMYCMYTHFATFQHHCSKYMVMYLLYECM